MSISLKRSAAYDDADGHRSCFDATRFVCGCLRAIWTVQPAAVAHRPDGSGTIFNDWQAMKTQGYVDMNDPTYLDLANRLLANSTITQAEYTQLTTPVATTEGP